MFLNPHFICVSKTHTKRTYKSSVLRLLFESIIVLMFLLGSIYFLWDRTILYFLHMQQLPENAFLETCCPVGMILLAVLCLLEINKATWIFDIETRTLKIIEYYLLSINENLYPLEDIVKIDIERVKPSRSYPYYVIKFHFEDESYGFTSFYKIEKCERLIEELQEFIS